YIDTYLSASLEIKELNIGGGFGINYLPEDRAKGYEEFFLPVLDKITKYFDQRGQKPPTIVTEPGRSIVGEAGLTLYRVGSIKKIEGLRTYVSVDGGMADNIRPALYQARYNGLLVSKAHLPAQEVVTIVGKCCESGDILIKDIPLPQVEKGDLLAVFSTGAYGYSMASNYNLLPKPGIVWVKEGKDYLVTQAQKVSQIYENDFPFPL
ncbi:MAG: diaminopimelate decarboxylase, partial [Tissierellia bacterium]|nr:diaminopimelate decarboxylase [Tissierellia bacterium]